MSVFLANPIGLLGLLAVPAIMAVYFLQQQSRRARISTLFLLERVAPASARGRRFERLRSSPDLWLALLAALAAAWCLAKPQWLRSDSVARVVLVLDSSASMGASRKGVLEMLPVRMAEAARAAAKTEWTIVESDPAKPRLYAGGNTADALGALSRWDPISGTHDAGEALRGAALVAGARGIVVFVTDREEAVPSGVRRWSVARAENNVGFAGMLAGADGWRALVVNYSDAPVQRGWTLGGRAMGVMEIAARGAVTVSGSYGPDGRAELKLDGGDALALDDFLPVVRPVPKPLGARVEGGGATADFFRRLAQASQLDGEAERKVWMGDVAVPGAVLPEGPAIVALRDPGTPRSLLGGQLVAERHPLTANIAFDGLLVKRSLPVERAEGSTPLVWAGDRPVVWLEPEARGGTLVLNFDLRHSNAMKHPGFVVFLSRYLGTVREAGPGKTTGNFEVGQILPGGDRAPGRPRYFEGVATKGAVSFVDVRECDLTCNTALDEWTDVARETRAANAAKDFFGPAWALVALAGSVGAWAWRERGGR